MLYEISFKLNFNGLVNFEPMQTNISKTQTYEQMYESIRVYYFCIVSFFMLITTGSTIRIITNTSV